MTIEEPTYEVIAEAPEYEVRRYEPYLVAEVDVTGSAKQAGNSAFRILAGYIFGDNQAQQKMSMTAPVESRPTQSEKMAMTAPVLSTIGDDGYTYAFVMEKQYTLDTLPLPNDKRIRIREKAGRDVAVRRFSGRWTEKNSHEHEQVMLRALERDGVNVTGNFEVARYDSPFKPWFLRRNEVQIPVSLQPGSE